MRLFFFQGIYPLKIALNSGSLFSLNPLSLLPLFFIVFLLFFFRLDQSLLLTGLFFNVLFAFLFNHLLRKGILPTLFPLNFSFILAQGQWVFELLGEILIDGSTALQNWASVFETLNLFHDEAGSIDFIFFAAVDGDDALSIFFLLVWKYFNLCAAGAVDDVSDHVAF